MHHQVLVGKLDGLAYAFEETEAIRNGKALVLAKLMDWNSIDVFHHKERFSLVSYAAILQPGNQRMVEPGKNLALEPETLPEKVSGQRQINQLDGYLLFEISIYAMSQIHGAHAAASDEPVNLICADTLSLVACGRVNARLPNTSTGKQFFLGARLKKRAHFR